MDPLTKTYAGYTGSDWDDVSAQEPTAKIIKVWRFILDVRSKF